MCHLVRATKSANLQKASKKEVARKQLRPKQSAKAKAKAREGHLQPKIPASSWASQPRLPTTNLKTARIDGKMTFLFFFNQEGCTKGAACVYELACSVLTSPNTVCGKNHPAFKDVGSTVAA